MPKQSTSGLTKASRLSKWAKGCNYCERSLRDTLTLPVLCDACKADRTKWPPTIAWNSSLPTPPRKMVFVGADSVAFGELSGTQVHLRDLLRLSRPGGSALPGPGGQSTCLTL
jgi:hypothetical protein